MVLYGDGRQVVNKPHVSATVLILNISNCTHVADPLSYPVLKLGCRDCQVQCVGFFLLFVNMCLHATFEIELCGILLSSHLIV